MNRRTIKNISEYDKINIMADISDILGISIFELMGV